MQYRKTKAGFLVGTSLLLSASVPGERIRWAPEEGSEITLTYSNSLDMVLDDFSAIFDGNDLGQMIGTPDMEMNFTSTVRLIDEFEAMSGERANSILRTIDEAAFESAFSVSVAGEGDDQSTDITAELAGRQVRFTWNEDEGDYTVRFEGEEESDDELLENLEADLGLAGLLPSEEVEIGDSWEIPADSLMRLGMPGGDPGWSSEGVEGMDEADMAELEAMMEPFLEDMMGNLEEMYAGAVTATYTGDRETDGVTFREVSLNFDIDGSVDLTSMIEEGIEKGLEMGGDDVPEDLEYSIASALLSFEGEGEGQLLWNSSTNVIHSLQSEFDCIIGMEFEASGSAMGESADIELMVEFSGVAETMVEAE